MSLMILKTFHWKACASVLDIRFVDKYNYTTGQKFGIIKMFQFLKEVSYAHQGCIHLINNTVKKSNMVKYYFNLR